MKHIFNLLPLTAVLLTPAVWADCGSIPFKPSATVFEPNQRAVIAFDGKVEILLLSTDLRASEPTKVLEVIPFPSEPRVAKGDVEVFRQATDLINQKLGRFLPKGAGGLGAGADTDRRALSPAGKVTFHKKIGAQDVSVVRVLDARRFTAWVEDYLKGAGVENPVIPHPLKLVVREYLKEGFTWFAFNVVELGTETATKEAVQYRFDTRWAYYPLRITRAEQGTTTVRLVMISPRLLRMPDLRTAKVRLMHQPVRVTADELRYLDEDIHKLLGNGPMLLRLWEVKGRLSGFKADIVAGWH